MSQNIVKENCQPVRVHVECDAQGREIPCGGVVVASILDATQARGRRGRESDATRGCRGAWLGWSFLIAAGAPDRDRDSPSLLPLANIRIHDTSTTLSHLTDSIIISLKNIRKLQLVKNVVVWAVLGDTKLAHVALLFRKLHWLLICYLRNFLTLL